MGMKDRRRTAIAIRHVMFEDLGMIDPVLTRRGYDIVYRDAGVDDLTDSAIAGADLLVVLGGPLGVNDTGVFPFLADECRVIEQRLARRAPTLGICLGAQLMAHVLGSRVYPASAKEIGWAPITLTDDGRASALGALATMPTVLHWHGDTFDLPARATGLASTPICANQAFSLEGALGLQFHLEVIPERIERWLIGHVHELMAENVDIFKLRRDTQQVGREARGVFEKTFEVWLAGTEQTSMKEVRG
jgi:GMP synthase (glutamine-hydrolysing)